jgi:hypothetical protein
MAILSARARRHSQGLVREWGLVQLDRRLMEEVGNRVLAGPFKGMVLTPMTCHEHVGPHLIGTYEAELQPWWDFLLRESFSQIVDVGAKFGYYAVGLAQRLPGIPAVAFDTDPWARRALREMAAANGTTGISVEAYCSPDWLDANLRERAFIICDCDGGEKDLFCSREIPALTSATLIIETHDHLVPGVSAEIVRRFTPTHTIQEVASRREPLRPALRVHSLTDEEMTRAANELRPPQTWLLLVPRSEKPTGEADPR